MFVNAYNEAREQGGINGLTPSEMFLQKLNTSNLNNTNKQKSVTHVGNQKYNLSVWMQHLEINIITISANPI